MSISTSVPKRGEIWKVNLDPTQGTEIQKTRPTVVMSSDHVGRLPLKLIAPITAWDERFSGSFWIVRLEPDRTNGLTKTSGVDTLQLRGVDLLRFIEKIGRLKSDQIQEIAEAIAGVIEY